jgi:hypothetical protein
MTTTETQYECDNPECRYYGKLFDESDLTHRQCHDGGCESIVIAECPGCQCDLTEVNN